MTDLSPVEEIFFAALAVADANERLAFLDRACGPDAGLRQRVDRLLKAHPQVGGFLGHPAGVDPDRTVDPDLVANNQRRDAPGTMIGGRFRLLEVIGEGGMGIVWLAEQFEPVRRQVAVKLIKAGMDTGAVLARFEAERQALALMDYPSIAKVFDGGAAESGRPYFVMELVRGVPITEYCDQNRLSPRERLGLFVPVCQAIQHAHQKGIVHRDVKPSNVLVTTHDGQPVVKVIDFGVAKAIGQQLTERTFSTHFAQMIGTPLYMSPEQAEMGGRDIDTRSDIYSLGVLLYELLTGTTPFDKQRLQRAAFDEVRRVIREEEPQKPSTRLSTSDSLPSVASQRQTEPAKLSRLVRGDLDWITMKCLEKDRARRYETANGLALDVMRYLADEPVLAGSPSVSYRLQKFVRRNKATVAALSAIALVLVGGIVGTTWQLLEAKKARAAEAERADGEANERRRAESAEKSAKTERDRANEEMRIAQAVRDFLQKDLLRQANAHRQADAIKAAGIDAKVEGNPRIKAVLDWAAAAVTPDKIDKKFPNQQRVQAEILQTIGDTYRAVGEFDKAIDHLQRSRAICNSALGPDHRTTLDTLYNLASVLMDKSRYKEAIEALELARTGFQRTVGVDEPATLTVLLALAIAYNEVGRKLEAIELYDHVYQARQRKFGPEHAATLRAAGNLGRAYFAADRIPEAIRLYQQVRDIQERTIGPEHPDTLTTITNLGQAYTHAGRFEEAIRDNARIRDIRYRQLGPDHPDTLITLNNLAQALTRAGRVAEASPIWEDMLPKARKRFGPEHPFTAHFLRNWITALDNDKQFDRAIQVAQEDVDSNRKHFGAGDVKVATSLALLGQVLVRSGRPEKAEPILRECLAIRLSKEPDLWATFHATAQLGSALLGQGKHAEAEPLLLQGYEGMKRTESQVPKVKAALASETIERIVQLFEALGKSDRVAEWKGKLPKP